MTQTRAGPHGSPQATHTAQTRQVHQGVGSIKTGKAGWACPPVPVASGEPTTEWSANPARRWAATPPNQYQQSITPAHAPEVNRKVSAVILNQTSLRIPGLNVAAWSPLESCQTPNQCTAGTDRRSPHQTTLHSPYLTVSYKSFWDKGSNCSEGGARYSFQSCQTDAKAVHAGAEIRSSLSSPTHVHHVSERGGRWEYGGGPALCPMPAHRTAIHVQNYELFLFWHRHALLHAVIAACA